MHDARGRSHRPSTQLPQGGFTGHQRGWQCWRRTSGAHAPRRQPKTTATDRCSAAGRRAGGQLRPQLSAAHGTPSGGRCQRRDALYPRRSTANVDSCPSAVSVRIREAAARSVCSAPHLGTCLSGCRCFSWRNGRRRTKRLADRRRISGVRRDDRSGGDQVTAGRSRRSGGKEPRVRSEPSRQDDQPECGEPE